MDDVEGLGNTLDFDIVHDNENKNLLEDFEKKN